LLFSSASFIIPKKGSLNATELSESVAASEFRSQVPACEVGMNIRCFWQWNHHEDSFLSKEDKGYIPTQRNRV
jgi:hypothetical protein